MNDCAGMIVALHLIDLGILQARADGEIWKIAKRTRTGRIVAIAPRRADYIQGNGYRGVHFKYGGLQFQVRAHVLWWTVVRGPIPEGYEINHDDGDKANNRPGNLQLLTHSENMEHAYRVGLRVVTPRMRAALDRSPVRGLRKVA